MNLLGNYKKIILSHLSLKNYHNCLVMNIKDTYVLDMLNKIIITDRLNKSQILQMVNLASISSNISDLKENLKWENTSSKH